MESVWLHVWLHLVCTTWQLNAAVVDAMTTFKNVALLLALLLRAALFSNLPATAISSEQCLHQAWSRKLPVLRSRGKLFDAQFWTICHFASACWLDSRVKRRASQAISVQGLADRQVLSLTVGQLPHQTRKDAQGQTRVMRCRGLVASLDRYVARLRGHGAILLISFSGTQIDGWAPQRHR